MRRLLQLIIQVLFLILFLLLIAMSRIHLWMGLFVLGIIMAARFSRIYCGWICPINTAMTFISWLKMRLHLKSIEKPTFLLKPWVRFIALAAFLAAFLVSIVSGVKLPVLPVLFMLGIITVSIFPADLWHRNLCPFGTLLSLPARLSKHSMRINPDKCVNCGICSKVCPAESVKRLDDSHHIIKDECLVCMKCARECPKKAIAYQ